MARKRVFLTGATGCMGMAGLRELMREGDLDVVALALPDKKDKALLAPFVRRGLTVVWGDLTCFEDVLRCVRGADVVLHVGALVSPLADYYPRRAMEVNYGSTVNIIDAIRACGQEESTRLVYIGTVAQTGDRMPPIHWGRVGDPIKPSVYDYYAVSKVAAERAVIESGLKHWVSLRQTGILSRKMSEIDDAIIFHNGLDNVLEYVSDRDSGVLLRKVCGPLPEHFWNHIYNVGGGAPCRVDTRTMFEHIFGALGIRNLDACLDSRWFASRNFHGQYYLDSGVLESFLHFRSDDMQYFYDTFLKSLGAAAAASRLLCRFPGGEAIVGGMIRRHFGRTVRTQNGTMRFVERNMERHVRAFWGSRSVWESIPPFSRLEPFRDWNTVIPIDHGYDESRPESELSLDDVRSAARFRGGECLSRSMTVGDWSAKLRFRCAFGHEFEASPRLVLQGGHWCGCCERESWNYSERAARDPFFAQVWRPLHPADEPPLYVRKEVSELDVRCGQNGNRRTVG